MGKDEVHQALFSMDLKTNKRETFFGLIIQNYYLSRGQNLESGSVGSLALHFVLRVKQGTVLWKIICQKLTATVNVKKFATTWQKPTFPQSQNPPIPVALG